MVYFVGSPTLRSAPSWNKGHSSFIFVFSGKFQLIGSEAGQDLNTQMRTNVKGAKFVLWSDEN